MNVEYEYIIIEPNLKISIIAFLRKIGFIDPEIELLIFILLGSSLITLKSIQTGINLNDSDIKTGIESLKTRGLMTENQENLETHFDLDIKSLKQLIREILKDKKDKNLKSDFRKLSPILFQRLRINQIIRAELFKHIKEEKTLELLKEHFQNTSREILIQTYFLRNLFEAIKEDIKTALLRGVNIKILILHPKSDLVEQNRHKSEIKEMYQRIKNLTNEIKSIIKERKTELRVGKLEIRYYGKRNILEGVFRGYIFDDFSAFITLWRFRPQGRGIDAPVLNIKDNNSLVFLLRLHFLKVWQKSNFISKVFKEISLISIMIILSLIILPFYLSIAMFSLVFTFIVSIIFNIYLRIRNSLFNRKIAIYEE